LLPLLSPVLRVLVPQLLELPLPELPESPALPVTQALRLRQSGEPLPASGGR
jgi:hypothetical protein